MVSADMVASALSRRQLAAAAARLNARHPMAGVLPSLVLMTDDERLPDPLPAAKALPGGSLIVLRARTTARRAELAAALRPLPHLLLVANDASLAARVGADGIHLAEANAGHAAHLRALHPRWLITAAAHSKLIDGPLNALFLSPIFPTASHPGAPALGAARANTLAQQSRTPLYALGGITPSNAHLLHGFVGIAAIGALDVQHGV
jgi:thiamine-phosphate pyrophosphorylase